MKETYTNIYLAITIFIILSTSFISMNNREVNTTIITIEKGMSLNAVSEMLLDKNVVVNKIYSS